MLWTTAATSERCPRGSESSSVSVTTGKRANSVRKVLVPGDAEKETSVNALKRMCAIRFPEGGAQHRPKMRRVHLYEPLVESGRNCLTVNALYTSPNMFKFSADLTSLRGGVYVFRRRRLDVSEVSLVFTTRPSTACSRGAPLDSRSISVHGKTFCVCLFSCGAAGVDARCNIRIAL